MTPFEKLQQVTERLRKLEQLHKENSVEIESLQLQIKALQKELGVSEPESKSLSTKEKTLPDSERKWTTSLQV